MSRSVHFNLKKKVTSSYLEVAAFSLSWFEPVRYKYLLLIFCGFWQTQAQAQNIQQILSLGGKGTVNPVVVETIGSDLLLVAGTFTGELIVGHEMVVANGADDVFVLMVKDDEVLWLKSIGNNFNDRISPEVIIENERLVLGLTFWEKLVIDSQSIMNPYGGQSFMLAYLDLTTGQVEQVDPIHSSGGINYAYFRAYQEDFLIGFWHENALFMDDGTQLVEDEVGLTFLTVSDSSVFSPKLFIKTSGQVYLTGMEMIDGAIVGSGYFLGTMELNQTEIHTQTIYYDGFAFRFDTNDETYVLKRFGGIFDNFFISAIALSNTYHIGGHFSGVLELGSGETIETSNTLSDIVVLTLDEQLNVVNLTKSEEESAAYLYKMYTDEGTIALSCQFNDQIKMGAQEVDCAADKINGVVFYKSDDILSIEKQVCITGNTLNLQHKKADLYKVTVFVTDQNFEWNEEVFNIEGSNDGFIALESTTNSNEKILMEAFTLFPNPAQTVLHWTVEGPVEYVDIFNAVGDFVMRTNDRKIDLSNFHPGIYFLHFLGENGQKTIGRFVKM